MKRSILLFLLAAAGFLTVSCTADKEPDYTKDIVGMYKGEIKSATTEQTTSVTQKIELTRTSYNVTEMTLYNFSCAIGGRTLNLGDVLIKPIVIEKSAGNSVYIVPATTAISLNTLGELKITVSGMFIGNYMDVRIDITEGDKNKTTLLFGGDKTSNTNDNTEALIKSITFSGITTTYTSVEKADSTFLTFFIADTISNNRLTIAPTITLSEGATVYPLSGVVQDFSKDAVNYTVTAQDGIHKRVYNVLFSKTRNYDFETWADTTYTFGSVTINCLETKNWASSNGGAAFIQAALTLFKGIPVTPSNDAKSGTKAAKMETFNTSGNDLIPYVTVGNLFLGEYKASLNTLTSTHYGIPFVAKPVKFSGWYKYIPGADYYEVGNIAEPNKATLNRAMIDSCSITAVLYEVTNVTTDFLTGATLNTSDKIVMRAELTDGSKKENWTQFELNFVPVNGKTYDPLKLYKLAIVCSPSRNANKFSGAPGSVLLVDDFVITSK